MGGQPLSWWDMVRKRCAGAVMLSKKKYNVNGDSGIKAQVRALFSTKIALFYLKVHLSLSISFFSPSFPSYFPHSGADFPPLREYPNPQITSLHFPCEQEV